MTHALAMIALVFAALGALTFVVVYELAADWRSTPLGRNVMAFMAAVAVLLALAIVRSFVPWLDEHVDAMRAGSFTLVGLIIWQRVYLLLRAQFTTSERRSRYRDGASTMHDDQGEERR